MKKTMFLKQLLTMLTALVMAVTMIPVGTIEARAYDAAKPLPDISGLSQSEAFVQVALSQKGYCEHSVDDTIYGYYTGKNKQPWCASFVAWCANKAGISNTVIPQKVSNAVNVASSNSIIKWYDARGQWYKTKYGAWNNSIYDQPKENVNYSPQRGDLILFETNDDESDGPDHIGIYLKTENGVIYTIEGNSSGKVNTNKYTNSSTIWGYCHPNWSDGSQSQSLSANPELTGKVNNKTVSFLWTCPYSYNSSDLIIWKDGKQYKSYSMGTSKSKTLTFKSDGNYTAYVCTYNGNTTKTSNGYEFTIKSSTNTPAPQKPILTIHQKSNKYSGKYVCISSSTSGATIYYTTDGTTPNKNSKSLKNGASVYVSSNCTVKTVAYLNGKYSSVGSKKVTKGVKFGDVNGDGSISLTDVSVLRNYINSSTKPKICVYNADVNGDGQVTLTDLSQINQYVLDNNTKFTANTTPTVTVKQSGSNAKVTVSSKVSKAQIYYTTNGNKPTNNDTKIANGSTLTINKNCTFRISVYLYGVRIGSTSKTVKLTSAKPIVPTVEVYQDNDSYSSKYVMLSSSTSGSKIYYTTDGTIPTTSSKYISNGNYIVLNGSSTATLKVVAYKNGAYSSVVTKNIHTTMKFGDANGDGKINNSDVEKINNYLLGKTAYICRYNADVNGDNDVTITDLQQVQKYVSGDLELFTLKDYPDVSIEYLEGSTEITVCTDTKEILYYSIDGGASYNTMNSGDTITLYSTSKFRVYGSIYGQKSYTYATTIKVEPKREKLRLTKPEIWETTFSEGKQISLYSAEGGDIYYKIYGIYEFRPSFEDTDNWIPYTQPFTITESSVIRAYAEKNGYYTSYGSELEVNVDSGNEVIYLNSLSEMRNYYLDMTLKTEITSYTLSDSENSKSVTIPKRSTLNTINAGGWEQVTVDYTVRVINACMNKADNIAVMIYVPEDAYNVDCPGVYKGIFSYMSQEYHGYECQLSGSIDINQLHNLYISYSMSISCTAQIVVELISAEFDDGYNKFNCNITPATFAQHIEHGQFLYTNYKESGTLQFVG